MYYFRNDNRLIDILRHSKSSKIKKSWKKLQNLLILYPFRKRELNFSQTLLLTFLYIEGPFWVSETSFRTILLYLLRGNGKALSTVYMSHNIDLKKENKTVSQMSEDVSWIEITSSILGWGYFFAWSLSFYGQFVLNYRNKRWFSIITKYSSIQ